MNKREIMQRLRSLELPKTEYWLVAGGAMVLYGIKPETRDIDLGCTEKLADRLEEEGYPTERTADGSRRFAIGSEVEIFEEWLFDRVEHVDGFPVISLAGLLMMKQSLGREKDRDDIASIERFLKNRPPRI